MPPRHLDPLRHQRAVEPGERHDIADRAERDEIEPLQQIGLARAAPYQPACAQRAVDRDDQQKGDPDRGERAMRARLVEPVGLTTASARRQQRLGDMMIDDDRRRARRRPPPPAARAPSSPQSTVTTTSAPSSLQAQQRRRVRAIAFAQPVGDVDPRRAADRREKTQQQRRRGRAVDVVVAEHGDRLAVADRPHEPLDRRIHVAQMRRVGQLLAQPRREKPRRLGRDRCRAAPAAGRQSRARPAARRSAAAPRSASRSRQRRPHAERSTPRNRSETQSDATLAHVQHAEA